MRCSWTRRALAMGFSPCLSKKRPSHGPSVRLRWASPPACRGKGRLMDLAYACDGIFPCFPPACRGKGRLMDLVCACDGLFPLPVEEKDVSWTWCALVMGFSLCLSRICIPSSPLAAPLAKNGAHSPSRACARRVGSVGSGVRHRRGGGVERGGCQKERGAAHPKV